MITNTDIETKAALEHMTGLLLEKLYKIQTIMGITESDELQLDRHVNDGGVHLDPIHS